MTNRHQGKARRKLEVTDLDLVRSGLDDEYEILEELGRGGMGIVYRARERQLEREVAIKVLPFTLAFDRELVERFLREARTAAALEHTNIVPIYRVGRRGDVIFFVMKLLRGQSVSDRLRAQGTPLGRGDATDHHRDGGSARATRIVAASCIAT